MGWFEVEIEGGNLGETNIEADSLNEAWEEAVDWATYGDWPAEGCRIRLSVTSIDDPEMERQEEIEIEPDEDALMKEAGADSNCDHKWTNEGEGGCSENPGVWSLGGTTMSYAEHCIHCGLRRLTTTYGSQRNPGQHDTIKYVLPGE